MREFAIVNASPLIFLSRGGHGELLRSLADSIWVPMAVAGEILARGADDPTAKFIAATSWLKLIQTVDIPDIVTRWGLGEGESSVIALGLSNPGVTLLMDDMEGRKCAMSLGLEVKGTLGIVLLAKKSGLITDARRVMMAMSMNGLYLSKRTLDEALRKVGE